MIKRHLIMVAAGICICSVPVFAAQSKTQIKGTALDSTIFGEVIFNEEEGGLAVEAYVANVPPGKHGFHIHANGSCADAGNAAGGHFNPDNVEHGYLPKDNHSHAHAGDMGNIDVDQDGRGVLKVFLPGVTFTEGPYAIMGKAVILHEKEDDFGQPTGNAGGRIGCGIIESAQ